MGIFIRRRGRVIRRNKGDIRRNDEVIRTSGNLDVQVHAFYFTMCEKAPGLKFIRTIMRDIRKCPGFIRKRLGDIRTNRTDISTTAGYIRRSAFY